MDIETQPLSLSNAKQIQVGAVTLDLTKNQLIAQGETHQLEPRLIRVLLVLCCHAGEVVSRDALLSAVSDLPYAGDESLTQAISKLRSVLGDNPKAPDYIKTIPRKGYMLLPSAQAIEPASQILAADGPKQQKISKPTLIALALMGVVIVALLLALWHNSGSDTEFIEEKDIEFFERQPN